LFAGTGDERQGLGTSEWVRTYVMGDLTWVKTMEKTTIRTEGVNLPHAVPDDLSILTRWLISRVDGRVASLTGKKVGKSSLLSKTKSFEAPRDALTRNVAMVATDFTTAYRELFADPALLVEQYAVIESGHAVSEPIVLRFCALGRELMEALETDYPYLKCEVPAGVEVSHYHNYLARHISEQGHAVLNLLAEYVADESNAAPLTEYEVYGSVMAVGVLMAGAVNDSRSQVYIANAVKYFKDKLHALQDKE